MRAVLLLAATLALAAAPALTQTAEPGPAPPPAPAPEPSNYMGSQYNSFADSPYMGLGSPKVCFSVGPVAAANRTGARTVYVQNRRGGIFRLDLADTCEALNAARQISVQSRGFQICAGEQATMVVKTEMGAKRCAVREVIRPTKAEITKLASAQR
jgi:hypothetical protein